MIGPDDWCINFDKVERTCKIYESRPNFCVVDKLTYQKIYKIDAEEFSDFCSFCCTENIADVSSCLLFDHLNFDLCIC